MSKNILNDLRQLMGLSTAQMAVVLGLDGANAEDRVREMERGGRDISGPLQKVLAYLAQGANLHDQSQSNVHTRILPTWLDCGDLEFDSSTTEFIMHTRWPRFIGWVTEKVSEDLYKALKTASAPIVPLDPELGHMVILFIDQPAGDTSALISEAARLKEAQTRRHVTAKR